MALRLMTEAFYGALNKKADYLASAINTFFKEEKIEARLFQYYSMMKIVVSHHTPSYQSLHRHLLSRGIVFPPSEAMPFFISGAHSRKDIDMLIADQGFL
jgi:glutamate-1-semialdehyde aminotransferase